jgi:signal transduction histidine kinase
MDTIGRLAGGIAHDFNNLLTVIGGASSFARELVPVDHPVQLELAEISRACERATGMTRKLLTAARKQSIEPVPLDLNDLIIDVERMLRRLIGAQIVIDLDLALDLVPVLADGAQIEQVLVNLAVNARDAMPAGGVLTISTRTEHLDDATSPARPASDRVIVEVRDTGVGMTPEVQAHIFNPYFTTKDPGLGTGLGLPTCYKIVEQHRGQITFESAPDRGTCFRVALPACSTPTAGPATAP